ncbi:MAG TPA: cytochrome c3 family protein [Candidatus Sulfotelmatobacter sp.]
MTSLPRLSTLLMFVVLLAGCLCLALPRLPDTQADCLRCHAEYETGKHVHSAVRMGCENCHVVEHRGKTLRVVLKKTEGGICQQCHAPQHFERVHLPYGLGMCTRCHDPHKSESPMLLRRSVNDLCLECHLRGSDDAPQHDLPVIELSIDNRMGHPYERHPVSGYTDPIRGEEMSCVSCHLAHGGAMANLLKMGSEIPEDALNRNSETKDMCHMCHLRLWGLDGSVEGKKKKRH